MADETSEPGEQRQAVPPADHQRTVGIEQHLRDTAQNARRGQRQHRSRMQDSGIAGRTAAAGFVAVKERDGESVTLQPKRTACADNASTNHQDACAAIGLRMFWSHNSTSMEMLRGLRNRTRRYCGQPVTHRLTSFSRRCQLEYCEPSPGRGAPGPAAPHDADLSARSDIRAERGRRASLRWSLCRRTGNADEGLSRSPGCVSHRCRGEPAGERTMVRALQPTRFRSAHLQDHTEPCAAGTPIAELALFEREKCCGGQRHGGAAGHRRHPRPRHSLPPRRDRSACRRVRPKSGGETSGVAAGCCGPGRS